jgi:hypothetical protein
MHKATSSELQPMSSAISDALGSRACWLGSELAQAANPIKQTASIRNFVSFIPK